jgi:Domain of unknown function (DUF3850)
MINIHKLKTWPLYFSAVRGGWKPFEIRKDDRDYKVGDVLILQCYDPATQTYNGEEEARLVTYITDYEQKPGFVVMGIAQC